MKLHVNAQVTLNLGAQQTLGTDVYERRHIEACGLLIGTSDEQTNWQVEQAIPLRNIAHSPAYFEFDPEELLAIELTYPGQIIGVYHSHPSGFAKASQTDRKNMKRVNQEQQIPWIWLIIRGPFTATFVEQAQGLLPPSSTIAYHHFEQGGLQQVTINYEQTGEQRVSSLHSSDSI
jgi:proteasome lid subunit RPN8/RPN11